MGLFRKVKIRNNGTEAPMEVVPQSTVPSTNLANGQIFYDDVTDQLYYYDSTRAKWLSLETFVISMGDDGAEDGSYLKSAGDIGIAANGYVVPFNCTLVYITANSSGGNLIKSFDIEADGTVVDSFSLTAGQANITNKNIDMVAGERINIFTSATGSAVNDPLVNLFVKWRK